MRGILAWAALALGAFALSAPAPAQTSALATDPVLDVAWLGRLATLAPACGLRDQGWSARLASSVGMAARTMAFQRAIAEGVALGDAQTWRPAGAAAFAMDEGARVFDRLGRAACDTLAGTAALRAADALIQRTAATPSPPAGRPDTDAAARRALPQAEQVETDTLQVACGLAPIAAAAADPGGATAELAFLSGATAMARLAAAAEFAAMRQPICAWLAAAATPNREAPQAIATPAHQSAADSGFAPQPSIATPDGTVASVGGRPDIETRFVGAVAAFAARYGAARTEADRAAAQVGRARALCGLLTSASVSGWQGEVEAIGANFDGHGTLAVRIGDNIALATNGTDFGSAIDHTAIPPDSKLFAKLRGLHPGQHVGFSGQFLPFQADCIAESSRTLRERMVAPRFSFRFADVEPGG